MKKKTMIRISLLLLISALLASAAAAGFAESEIAVLPIDLSGGAPYKQTYKSNPESYEDPTISVQFFKGKTDVPNQGKVFYFYALVQIQHASQLRTAAADPADFNRARWGPAKNMAKRVNAVLAVNGDFSNFHVQTESSKFCLRQGKIYRDTLAEKLDMLMIDEEGDFHVIPGGPELAGISKEEIDGRKVINAFQFGPALVLNGEPVADEYVTDPAHSPWGANPDEHTARMCIGQIDRLSYFVLTCWDGMDLAQFRDFALSLVPSCRTLYVLDGGNSAQMIYLKSQVNLEDTKNNARDIGDIIYFASADFSR